MYSRFWGGDDPFAYDSGYEFGYQAGNFIEGNLRIVNALVITAHNSNMVTTSLGVKATGDVQLLAANIKFESTAHEIAEARNYPLPPHIQVLMPTR